ncbi:MAG: hypothetical protein H0X24_18315, partial [Ktedonobacterales bacterium]|nr:hypothetical protein [Ktedonobacterales bacterium]
MRQERDDELPPLSSFADGRYVRKPRASQPPTPRAEPPRRATTPPRPSAPASRRSSAARPAQTPRTVTVRPHKTLPPSAAGPEYDIDFQTSQARATEAPRAAQPIINFKSYHIARQSQASERVEPEAV